MQYAIAEAILSSYLQLSVLCRWPIKKGVGTIIQVGDPTGISLTFRPGFGSRCVCIQTQRILTVGVYGVTHVSYWRSFPPRFAIYLTTSRFYGRFFAYSLQHVEENFV